MRPAISLRHLTLPAVMAGFVAVLVGYTSSAAIIFQAAAAAGAAPVQIGGWLSMLGLGMGVTSLGLSLYYRTPILTAWSTLARRCWSPACPARRSTKRLACLSLPPG